MSDYFLADDLSGALDAAAAFHHTGRRVLITLSPDVWPVVAGDDVVGVTTETRNAAPAAAAHAVQRALELGRARGGRMLYKKIDSTLRGPVAAELAALVAALPGRQILFAPANPAAGRTVRDGVLRVHGVPVAETEFARDPASPVKESVIRRLLGRVADSRIVIADAMEPADLAAAVARMEASGDPWVAVGSGALAKPVAARFAAQPPGNRRQGTGDGGQGAGDGRQSTGGGGQATEDRGRESSEASLHRSSDSHLSSDSSFLSPVSCPLSPAPRPLSPVTPGPCLFVCGSAHAGNRSQAAVLASERGVRMCELSIGEPSAAVAAALGALHQGRSAALVVEERRGERAVVIQTLTNGAVQVITATRVRRVFVTGGETAFALCRGLGISVLTFRAEIEPGLSVSCAPGAGGHEAALMFAIKPGGFGSDGTWVRAWDALADA